MFGALLFLSVIAFLAYYYHRHVIYGFQYLKIRLELRRFIGLNETTADAFDARVRATPNRIACIFEGRVYTFSDLEIESNRVAAWGLDIGLRPRDVVALVAENSVQFLTTWIGMTKIGVTTALVNTNLRGVGLTHSIRCCDARVIIVGAECWDAFNAIRSEITSPVRIVVLGGQPSAPYLSLPGVEDLSSSLVFIPANPNHTAKFSAIRKAAKLNSNDLVFYIFTSGTTGLPKAAKLKHARWQLTGVAFSVFFGVLPTDRFYCALPLYHTAGGTIGWSCSWYTGCSVVLRRKFSASRFFEDCASNDVTIIQYIGQLARYLLSTPPGPYDQKHSVRMAIGNGLSEDVWDPFKDRFSIDRIGEFYGASESNANLVNNLNLKGVIGWIPTSARWIYPVRIVRFDPIEERPIRDARGFCIECKPNEVGELLSKIDQKDPLKSFAGYSNERATSDKIFTNVFAERDSWFRSGDLVRADENGYIRFVDRVGDTYRWKGENVATTEVAAIIGMFRSTDIHKTMKIEEANVYGVTITGHEGRAGMACLGFEKMEGEAPREFSESEFDLAGLYQYLHSQLPSYQNPLFLRMARTMDITSTFKHRKGDLVREGFDPTTIHDPIYFRDDLQKRYVRLEANLFNAINQGRVRL